MALLTITCLQHFNQSQVAFCNLEERQVQLFTFSPYPLSLFSRSQDFRGYEILTNLFASTLIKQNESVAILTGISVYIMSKHLCWYKHHKNTNLERTVGSMWVHACAQQVFQEKKKKPINFTRRLIKNSLCSSSLSFLSEVIDQNYIIALILA